MGRDPKPKPLEAGQGQGRGGQGPGQGILGLGRQVSGVGWGREWGARAEAEGQTG